MSDTRKGLGLGLGSALLALLALPGAGWIILALIIVFIAIFLGLFITVYTTLSSLHLFTPIIFTVVILAMIVLSARAGILNKDTLRENSWIWLLIPGAFVIGYFFDVMSPAGLTIAPMATLSSGSSSVAVSDITLFLFISLALGLAGSLIGGSKKRRQIDGPRYVRY